MMSRVVLISGASSGLGLSLTENFLALGDTVYGVTKTKRHWGGAKARLRDFKTLHFIQADLSREAAVKKLFARIRKETGRVDILINNAGYANRPTPFEKESLKELNQNLSDNLITVFLMCKHALPFFKKQKSGWILNVSSMAGKRAVPLLATYSASKFGVLALTQSLAKEHAEAGFRAVTVCPGGMNTRMRAKLFGKNEAETQQSPDFVAEKIMEIIEGKIAVPHGGDIVIRHNQVAAVHAAPDA